MKAKRFTKNRLRNAIFGCLFGVIGAFVGLLSLAVMAEPVYAEPTEVVQAAEIEGEDIDAVTNAAANATNNSGESCQDSLGAIGWLVCPTTGKISEAVDWLYDKIETILVINPVKMEDGSPIYEIWKYMLGITNIVFIIFLLVVVYSQLTGYGISNYGVKKALPKLIVAAILVNLSFVICSLAVDLSNVIGDSLRGLFTSIEESTMGSINITGGMKMSEMYSALAGGSALAIGAGMVAFEMGAIWMLIPTVLGAIVSVVIGLVTIAMRQAVVALLIMISPLAIVAYMLPNTEQWFKKWKDLLIKMLVFYPMFSLLFGASSLAGWAIIASSTDGFGVILGVAVQIFPLFFAWSLMKMSGTFLSTINSKLTGLAARPLAANRSWAESHRDATRAKKLASGKVYTPSQRLAQYLSDRKIAREEETREHSETIKNRGLAYNVRRNYKRGNLDEAPSREGEEAYEEQARNMKYASIINRHKVNMNMGLGQLESVKASTDLAQKARLKKLDIANVNAADNLKYELARGAKVELENARGFYDRTNDAMNAYFDNEALQRGDNKYKLHGVLDNPDNLERYNRIKNIMEGKDIDTHFAAAEAFHSFNAQSQIAKGKFKDYFNLTAPTQDVENRLKHLTSSKDSNKYIDPIISGLQTLNMRGDTDIIRRQLENVLADKKVELGTYTSQSLANFLMFDVKGNDPFLRRFGKYINLETAQMFNEAEPGKRRTRKDVSLDEYVNGEYVDYDEEGNMMRNDDGTPRIRKAKRGADVLLKGTSFKDMERTAIKNMTEGIRESSVDIDSEGNRKFNYEKFKENEFKIWDAIMPNIISDQFSYLSGSEPIAALSQGITGVDMKERTFNWKGIFGDYAKDLTDEQKEDYLEFIGKRMSYFQGGHVPSQIARTKTDMLDAMKTQLALKNAAEHDAELAEKLKDPNFKWSNDENENKRLEEVKGKYNETLNKYLPEVKEDFVKMYKEDALRGFIKMHHKGYQGEAKDGLIQLLEPDKLYEQYFPNGENGRRNKSGNQVEENDDDDGMPVIGNSGADDNGSGPIYSDLRNDIEATFNSYRGSMGNDVIGFWDQVKDSVLASPEISGKEAIVSDFEAGLSQYTDVATLYNDIINRLFGGF